MAVSNSEARGFPSATTASSEKSKCIKTCEFIRLILISLHLWIFRFSRVRSENIKIQFSYCLQPDDRIARSAIAELVSMIFAAQKINPKCSETFKQNTEFLMFSQLPTLKHIEIPMLKALVEMYPYVIAVEYQLCSAQSTYSKSRKYQSKKFSFQI